MSKAPSGPAVFRTRLAGKVGNRWENHAVADRYIQGVAIGSGLYYAVVKPLQTTQAREPEVGSRLKAVFTGRVGRAAVTLYIAPYCVLLVRRIEKRKKS